MNTKQIKEEAKNYFSKGNYREAVTTLWELGVDDFISFGLKNEWFKNENFLEHICYIQNIFSSILKSKKSDEILFQYFTADNLFSQILEDKVVFEFPDLYINAVRVSQVFLQKERLDFLCTLHFDKDYRTHQEVWKRLYKTDNHNWISIQNELGKLSKISLSDILTGTVIWLENKKSKLQDEEHIASIYSFFINLYLQKYPANNQSLSQEKKSKEFFSKINKPINQILSKLLELINQWIVFNSAILSSYCYDLNIEPKEENGIIYFNQSPETYYKWQLDGTRYKVNSYEYIFRFVYPNNYPIRKEDVIELKKEKIKLFLDDLNIENLNNISVADLYSPLITYSVNCKPEYAKSENYLPYILIPKSDFINNKIEEVSNMLPEISKQIVGIFSYKEKSKNDFNRFNIGYNVWNEPFIQIGGMLFCPTMFFTNNDWFYAFAQASLKNLDFNSNKYERKRTSTLMEINLGERFQEKGWFAKIINDKEANSINGDVDIIVEDENTTLFIQLKRTYFRLTLKDTYYESINPDRKATQQLNDAEEYLSKKNDIFKPKNKPVKWVVTTSYENISDDIDDCKKVNYFDILNALHRPFGKTLKDLIDFIHQDRLIQNLIDIYNSGDPSYQLYAESVADAGLPLQLVEPRYYRKPLFAVNDDYQEYSKKYDKAMEAYRNAEYKTAIGILQECSKITPNNHSIYGDLGNCYANIKDYKNSFDAFEKALEIVPNEPYIMRNFAIALMEAEKYFESFNVVIDLYEMYPFVHDFKFQFDVEFKHNFDVAKEYGKLKKEEIIILKNKLFYSRKKI